MKSLIIADTHYGVRQDKAEFYDYQKKFFHKVLFPFIDKYQIKRLIHLGDLVDNRKSMNYLTKKRMQDDFLNPLKDMDLEIEWVVGNHDAHFKDTLAINAIEEFASSGRIHAGFSTVDIDGHSCDFVPWICRSNADDISERIAASASPFCFGHFELKGFQDNSGGYTTYGMDRGILKRYDKVFSGHFHKRSQQDNIRYVGATFEYTWADYGDYRGFCTFDPDAPKPINFYRNPFNIFSVLDYSNGLGMDLSVLKSKVQQTYCRLIVKEKDSEAKLKDAIKLIEDVGVLDLTVFDETAKVALVGGDTDQSEDMVRDMYNYIDQFEIPSPDKVKKKFTEIYTEALQEL